MRSRRLGVVAVLALALAGVHCAAGSEIPGGDGGAQVDAAGDGEPTGDGPAQADVPVQEDGPQQADGPLQSDGPQQSDGLLQSDRPQQDGGCNVQNTGACDPVCQNCAGQKCSLDPSNHQVAACMTNGTMGPGETCTGDANGDNCVAGFICLSAGKCIQFCRTDGDCVAYNGACILGISWGGTTPFRACKNPDACDPVANTGCATSGTGCFLWANDHQTFCLTAGTGGDGTACPNGNECKGGFVCVGASAADYKCRQICHITPPTGCTGSYTCQTLSGFTTYGYCA
jgi:hypothetical protein